MKAEEIQEIVSRYLQDKPEYPWVNKEGSSTAIQDPIEYLSKTNPKLLKEICTDIENAIGNNQRVVPVWPTLTETSTDAFKFSIALISSNNQEQDEAIIIDATPHKTYDIVFPTAPEDDTILKKYLVQYHLFFKIVQFYILGKSSKSVIFKTPANIFVADTIDSLFYDGDGKLSMTIPTANGQSIVINLSTPLNEADLDFSDTFFQLDPTFIEEATQGAVKKKIANIFDTSGFKLWLYLQTIFDEAMKTNQTEAVFVLDEYLTVAGYKERTHGGHRNSVKSDVIEKLKALNEPTITIKKSHAKTEVWAKSKLFIIEAEYGTNESGRIAQYAAKVKMGEAYGYASTLQGKKLFAPLNSRIIGIPDRQKIALRLGVALARYWKKDSREAKKQGRPICHKAEIGKLIKERALFTTAEITKNKKRCLERLESELDELVARQCMGSWHAEVRADERQKEQSITGGETRISRWAHDPLKHGVLYFYPPKEYETWYFTDTPVLSSPPPQLPAPVKVTQEELQEIINNSGLSLRKAAEKIGIDPGFLSRILQGKKRPSPEVLARIVALKTED